MCLGPLCHALLHKSEREPASECSLCRMPEQQECSTLLWTLHKNVHPDSSAGYPASFCRLLEGRGRGERCSAFCCTFCFVLSDSSQQLWRNFGFCHCCLLQPAAGAGPRRAPCGGSECSSDLTQKRLPQAMIHSCSSPHVCCRSKAAASAGRIPTGPRLATEMNV